MSKLKPESKNKDVLHIVVYTDGACSGNPGPGGWGALILIKNVTTGKKHKEIISGGEKHSTNNRMELSAVIEALNFIRKKLFKKYFCQIKVHSDSSYVVNSINNNDLLRWQENGWKTKRDTPISNQDLWEKIVKLDNRLSPEFIKVKGHADNKFNNFVDELAVKECQKYKRG